MSVNSLISILVFMPIAGAFLSYVIGRKSKQGRNVFACGLTILEFICSLLLWGSLKPEQSIHFAIPEICGMGLSFTIDGFRVIYAAIAAFMWMMTTILSTEYFAHYRNRNRYYLFLLLYLTYL